MLNDAETWRLIAVALLSIFATHWYETRRQAQEVRREAGKVTWPTWKETWLTTIMVFIMVIISMAFFFVVDWFLSVGVRWLIGIG